MKTTIAILGALLACNVAFAEDDEDKTGEQLYHEWGCAWCHGYFGHGGASGGPRALAPTPYPFEAFATFVRKPVRLMPPYPPAQLGDAQLRKIYDFVKSIEASPSADTVPQLIEMRERYRKLD